MDLNFIQYILPTILALAALCGLSLYLTLGICGLGIHFGWFQVPAWASGLDMLGDPVVIAILAVFSLLEFAWDKIRWINTISDFVHTLIRPLGAVFLASKATDTLDNPVLIILCVIFAGMLALAAHLLKAGIHSAVNIHPAASLTIALGLLEKVMVVVLVFAVFNFQDFVLAAVGLFLLVFALSFSWLLRNFNAQFQFLLGRFKARDFETDPEKVVLPTVLDYRFEARLRTQKDPDERFEWAMPCFTGRMTRIGWNVPGYLIQTSNHMALYFIGRKNGRTVYRNANFFNCKVGYEENYLFDAIRVRDVKTRSMYTFRFPKHHQAYARKIYNILSARQQDYDTTRQEKRSAPSQDTKKA